jgi:cystathionine beta-lyase
VMVGIQEVVRHVTGRGEGVVITPPCYPPYFAEIPRELVEVPLLEGFALDFDGLDAAFAAGARAMVLCHPHNPTGRIAPVEELQRLASLADAWGVHVIADEIHSPLRFGEFTTWAKVSENGSVLTSASKAFNLPALKLAFVVGSVAEELPQDLRDHAGLLGVIASEAAFRDGDAWLDETIATIRANHARVRDGLPEGVRVAHQPEAGYLTWLDCRYAGLGDDPAAAFLEHGRVALYSGLRFGAAGAGYARLNVGTTPELVEEALTRLRSAVAR